MGLKISLQDRLLQQSPSNMRRVDTLPVSVIFGLEETEVILEQVLWTREIPINDSYSIVWKPLL